MINGDSYQDLLMKNGEPRLPENWTYLIHGTQKSRWDEKAIGQDFTVTRIALSCIDKYESDRQKKEDGSYDTTKNYQGTTSPFQIRVVYMENPQISKSVKKRLSASDFDQDLSREIRRCYGFQGGRHPGIPHGTKLVRVSETLTKDNIPVYWYVPEKMLSLYREDVMKQRIAEKVNDLMAMNYELDQYKAFYADDFRRGVTPKENFEEFRAYHPETSAMTKNEDGHMEETLQFKFWQKKKGYHISHSLSTLNLRKMAQSAIEREDNLKTQQRSAVNVGRES